MSADASKEMALTLVRGSLAIAVVGALACLVASTQLPFLTLNVEAIHSSIEQGLWDTHVRTPLGYRDVRAVEFWNCEELLSAFKGAQSATFLAIVFASLGFLFAIFNISSFFSQTTQRVRWVCGAPLMLFVFLALLGQLVTLAIVDAMYSRDWCAETDKNLTQTGLGGDRPLSLADESCDPFDGCVRSFKEMGFDFQTGHQVACAASIFLTVAIFCELLVCAFGGSDVDEEDEHVRRGEPAVSLLTSGGRPNNSETRGVEDTAAERLV